MLIISRN